MVLREKYSIFLENEHDLTKELVHEKSIPEIQQSVIDGKLTYYKLSLFT